MKLPRTWNCPALPYSITLYLIFCELQLVQEATEVNTKIFQISTYLLLLLQFVLAIGSYSFIFIGHFPFIFFTNSLTLNLNYNHKSYVNACMYLWLFPLALSSSLTSCTFHSHQYTVLLVLLHNVPQSLQYC